MPAELDMSKGRAAILSVGQTPWHREGVVLEHPPESIDEALQMAGLDFDVALAPLYVHAEHMGNQYELVNDFKAIGRSDVNKFLGIVGSRYTPLQNRDAFRLLEPLLKERVASIETAGSLREGRDVWILVRFDIDDPVVKEVFADEVVPFGLISNNHTGERRVILQETPVRVVCSNTLGAALTGSGRKIGVRHTLNVEAKVVDAAQELWGGLIERYRRIAEQYRILKNTYLDEALFRELVLDTAAPFRPELLKQNLSEPQQKARDRVQRKRDRLKDLWTNGNGHKGDQSAWDAYNAVAQSLDHDLELWPTLGQRTASLFDGHLARIKQQVLNALADSA